MNKFVRCLLFDFVGLIGSLVIAGFGLSSGFLPEEVDTSHGLAGIVVYLFFSSLISCIFDLIKLIRNRKSSAEADGNK